MDARDKGQGRVLAAWLNTSNQEVLADVGTPGGAQINFQVGIGSMVLGDDNVAFANSGDSIMAFSVPSLTPTWSYASTGGALSLVAATSGGGVTINDSQQGIIQLDSSGNASTPIPSLQSATPIATATTVSDFSGVGVGIWEAITNGEATEIIGPIQDADSLWPGPTGALQGQQSAAAQGIPVNFVQTGEFNLPDGTLLFTYKWSSSTGKPSDLSSCLSGEVVTYPGTSDPYLFPAPMQQTVSNPTTPTPFSAAWVGSNDHQYPPVSYSKPYFSAGFSATQQYWWSCPYYQNGAHINFVPNITISRQVFQDTDGYWKYQATKSGSTGFSVQLPNQ